MRKWLLLLLLLLQFVSCFPAAASASEPAAVQDVSAFLEQLFQDRTQFLIHGKLETIEGYYIKTEKSSRQALQHEAERWRYLQTWSEKRHLQFVNGQSRIRVIRTRPYGDRVKVSMLDTTRLDYSYLSTTDHLESFGIGTRHVLTLKNINGRWHVFQEWYLDPLEENPELVADYAGKFPQPLNDTRHNTLEKKKRYNRNQAIDYANKYAGWAWGAGNNNRYNQKYRDYTGEGGDCTNFASQVIGDPKEGGGLQMRGGWQANRSGGSQAWVNTDGFKNFLLYSGYANLIARGQFADVIKSNSKYPQGAISELQPGDLIAYELHGDVDHFAILVGFDHNGYPLVNSHTTDRYQVPFDLGWDKTTKYLLFHIRD